MEGVPEALREDVLNFFKAHGLEAPGALAAVAPEDLTQAFDAEPPAFTLGHRASIRRLREAACLRQPRPRPRWHALTAALAECLRPSRWLAPSVVRAGETLRKLQRGFPGLCVSFHAIVISGVLGLAFETLDVWQFLTEWDVRCDHPPLPGNDTGIKYLVASMTRVGARTMSQSLYDAGIEKSYQGVDLSMLLWSGLHDDYHWRPENGGWFNNDHVLARVSDAYRKPVKADIQVLLNLPPAELASAVSRCRIEALSFAGAENLFFPIMRVSPNATVILVHTENNWMAAEFSYPWDEETLNPNFVWSMPLLVLWRSAPHMLPWPALLHWIDPLIGGEIRQRLASGGPPLTQVWGPYIYLWYQGLQFRRALAHRSAGLQWGAPFPHAKRVVGQRIRAEVPKSRLKEWDLEKNVWPELCELVNASQCKWKDILRRQKEVPDFKFEKPGPFWQVTVVFVVLIWLNALFLMYVWRLLESFVGLPICYPLRRIYSGITGYFSQTIAGLKLLYKLAMVGAFVAYFVACWVITAKIASFSFMNL